jgi:hypothetical protein
MVLDVVQATNFQIVSHVLRCLIVKTNCFWMVADGVHACESMEFAFLTMQFDSPGTYEVDCNFLPRKD